MTGDLEVVIDVDGTVQFVYADDLAALFDGDDLRTARASYVEPWGEWLGWGADLVPVGGPLLGPFTTRQAALDAEVAWLRAEMARRRLEAR